MPSKRPAASAKPTSERPSKKAKKEVVEEVSSGDEPDFSEDDENELDEEEGEGLDDGFDEEEGAEDEMNVDGEPSAAGKNNQNKVNRAEERKTQKALLKERKSHKSNYDLIALAKKQWQQLLASRTASKSERKKLVDGLMEIVKGQINTLCTKHDASRIVQSLVKYGSNQDREQVATELDGAWKDIIRGRYSKFLFLKIVRLLPARRMGILQQAVPPQKLVKLLLHAEASSVLSDVFELYSNEKERAYLVKGFWGKEVALFSSTSQTTKSASLQAILEEFGEDVERRKRVLREVKANIDSVFANENKSTCTHPIVHRAVYEYFLAISNPANVPDHALQATLRAELFEAVQGSLPELVHTRHGSKAARLFVAWGNAKDRKVILKIIKPHVTKMATNEEASLVLITLMDCIDDTKLLVKTFLPSLAPTLEFITNVASRRLLLYPFVNRSTKHFTPALIREIAETDEIWRGTEEREGTSKKDEEVRKKEIREGLSPDSIRWVEQTGEQILRGQTPPQTQGDSGKESAGTSGTLFIEEICLNAVGDKSKIQETLLRPLLDPYPSASKNAPHVLDQPYISRLYKTLFQGGRKGKGKESSTSDCWPNAQFAVSFFQTLGEERVVDMCVKGQRNGSWVVVGALEGLFFPSSSPEEEVEGKEEVRKEVKKWFGKQVKKDIEDGEGKGKGVLLEVLAKL